jgi:hypothetical protein
MLPEKDTPSNIVREFVLETTVVSIRLGLSADGDV